MLHCLCLSWAGTVAILSPGLLCKGGLACTSCEGCASFSPSLWPLHSLCAYPGSVCVAGLIFNLTTTTSCWASTGRWGEAGTTGWAGALLPSLAWALSIHRDLCQAPSTSRCSEANRWGCQLCLRPVFPNSVKRAQNRGEAPVSSWWHSGPASLGVCDAD